MFYPPILLATAGSIGAGLDSPDVYIVCRAGFITSILKWRRKRVDLAEGNKMSQVQSQIISI